MRLFMRAVEMWSRVWGPDHLLVANAQVNLCTVCYSAGSLQQVSRRRPYQQGAHKSALTTTPRTQPAGTALDSHVLRQKSNTSSDAIECSTRDSAKKCGDEHVAGARLCSTSAGDTQDCRRPQPSAVCGSACQHGRGAACAARRRSRTQGSREAPLGGHRNLRALARRPAP